MARHPADGGDELLTTRAAARMLEVGASTVKRWADDGLLAHVRTAGGHRRFPRSEVERFLQAQMGGPAPIESQVDRWLSILLGEADHFTLAAELMLRRSANGAWWRVADEFASVLEELGNRWATGQISVLEEHRASERLSRLLAWCSQTLPVVQGSKRVLLLTAEGDEHTLGLSLVELCLREAGLDCVWAGRKVPYEDVLDWIERQEISMVAISAAWSSSNSEDLRRQAERLGDAASAQGIQVLFGGNGAWPHKPSYGHRIRSFAELHRVLGELSR